LSLGVTWLRLDPSVGLVEVQGEPGADYGGAGLELGTVAV
jgi:hypothetical protein